MTVIQDIEPPKDEPEISKKALNAYVPESEVIPPEGDDGENQS